MGRGSQPGWDLGTSLEAESDKEHAGGGLFLPPAPCLAAPTKECLGETGGN